MVLAANAALLLAAAEVARIFGQFATLILFHLTFNEFRANLRRVDTSLSRLEQLHFYFNRYAEWFYSFAQPHAIQVQRYAILVQREAILPQPYAILATANSPGVIVRHSRRTTCYSGAIGPFSHNHLNVL
jgi:hypothetical protein